MVGPGAIFLVLLGMISPALAEPLFPQNDIGILIEPASLKIRRVYFVAADLQEHLDRLDVQFVDSNSQKLRENHWQFLSYGGKDYFACPEKDISESATEIFNEVETSPDLSQVDPYGLKLLVASSYLGRCQFDENENRLKNLYQRLGKGGEADKQIVFYPSTIGFYSEGDLNVLPNQKYLFALRMGILLGHLRRGEGMPTEFDLPENEINETMRPGKLSDAGFIGPKENFKEIIASDRALLAKYRLDGEIVTPEVIAQTLIDLLRTFHGQVQRPDSPRQSPKIYAATVKFREMRYEISCDTSAARWQVSPFKDGLQGVCDYTIKNHSTGASMFIAGIVPPLIAARHFFEGLDTPYRVDPKALLNLF